MSKNRSVLTNKELLEDVTVLRELADALEDVAVNGVSIEKMVEEHGYKQTNLRKAISDLQPLKHDQNRLCGKQLQVNYDVSYILSFSERAYQDIFGIDDREFAETTLPADFEETLAKVAEDTLSPRQLDIFNRRCQGETYEAIAKSYNVTRERVRQIYERSIQKLRSPRNQEVLSLGLNEYRLQEEKRLKEKQEKDQLIREGEAIRMDVFREEAGKIARERTSNLSQEAELQELILDYFLSRDKSETPEGIRFMIGWEKIPIGKLNLSVRTFNCLKRVGCETLGDVSELIQNKKLSSVRNLGRKSEDEILEKYHAYSGL